MAKKSELQNMEELYVHELKDIYSAEKQITKALPKIINGSTSKDLKRGFQKHLEQTQGQIERLNRIFERLGKDATGPKCKGMEGLLEEGEDFLKEEASADILDAGIIVGAQKVEHYEIASYGSLCTFADQLGFDEDLELLEATLKEEIETDEKLKVIAESQ